MNLYPNAQEEDQHGGKIVRILVELIKLMIQLLILLYFSDHDHIAFHYAI